MADPTIAQRGPYVVEETAGKKMWCACGLSKKQPYCDGMSHNATEFSPEFVFLDEAKKVAWCGCKQSGNKPFCDGSHSKLK